MDRASYLQDHYLYHLRGNDLPQSKLNASKVREIRANVRGLTARQLACVYGVHYRTIEKIRHYETWIHV